MKTLASSLLLFLSTLIVQSQSSQIKFIENKGQLVSVEGKLAPDVLFYADTKNVRYLIRQTGISYVLLKDLQNLKRTPITNSNSIVEIEKKLLETTEIQGCRIDMNWINSLNNTQCIGQNPFKHKLNYYTPQFPNGLLGVLSYEKVLLKNIYKNIDVLVYSNGMQLKYDYILHKNANINSIKFDYIGAEGVNLENDTLYIKTPFAIIKDFIPESHAIKGGKNIDLKLHFRKNQTNLFSIETNTELAQFEKIIIDPAIWITYFGGSSIDYAIDIESDKKGNLFMGGYTGSFDFPLSAGAFQTTFPLAAGGAPFLAKFDKLGNMVWSTYYSGTYVDEAHGICVDTLSNVYMCGFTYSTDFPVTVGAYQTSIVGAGANADCFVVKFDENGIRIWSTYFGGITFDIANKIDVDDNQNVWFTGGTTSADFPTLFPNQPVYGGGGNDVFLAEFSSTGSLLYSTFHGGNQEEMGVDIDFTPGFVGIVGNTSSPGFPKTADAYDASLGGIDGFYSKFNLTGNLVYSTLLGGSAMDLPQSIKYDNVFNAVVGGHTASTNFPVTAGAYQTVYGGDANDCFMAKFKADNTINWVTYYGTSYQENGAGIAIDKDDNIYLNSEWEEDIFVGLPVTSCAYQHNFAGIEDQFIVKFNALGEELCMTYLGGINEDDIDVSLANIEYSNGFIYHACYTAGDYPVTPGAYQTTFFGYYDVGLAKLCTIGCGDTMATQANFNLMADTLCPNIPIQLNAGSIVCDTSLVTYLWSMPGATPATATTKDISITYTALGSYSVTLTVFSLCDTSVKTVPVIIVNLAILTLSITPSTDTICAGTPITITSSVIGGTAPYNYQWSSSATDTSATLVTSPSSSGNISLTVDNNNSCTTTESVFITVLPLPNLVSSNDTCVCDGTAVTLTATGAPSYLWSTGQTSSSITVTPDTLTSYIVSFINGICNDADTTTICIKPAAFVLASNDTTITDLENYDGVLVQLIAVGDAPFTWTPSTGLSCIVCPDPIANVIYTTTYTVSVTNAFGCTATDQVTITTEFVLNIPNIVTANNDGSNDKFFIQGLPPNSTLIIFNRWGNLLYKTDNYSNDWETVTEGVYYYILTTPKGKQYPGFFHVVKN